MCRYLPKRLELSFLLVTAHPNNSRRAVDRRKISLTLEKQFRKGKEIRKPAGWKKQKNGNDKLTFQFHAAFLHW